MTPTEEIGALPLNTGQYNVTINASTALTLPTTAQRKKKGGILSAYISVEAQNARYTIDGTTPTTTNGVLVAAPALITLRGEQLISAFRIIAATAGAIINYGFAVGDSG